MQVSFSEYLQYLLHNISQALLVPTMLLLAICVAIALFAIGSIIAEYFTERHHYKVVMPDFLARITAAHTEDLNAVIEESGLLLREQGTLKTLVAYMGLPSDALVALAKRLLASTEQRYNNKVQRTDTLAKVSPMLGLMGTLIPLGPGIVALGEGKQDVLASSLMIAFDTTVIGLVAAVVCFVVSRIRRAWYEDYIVSTESSLTTLLEKAQEYTGPKIADLTIDEIAQLAPVESEQRDLLQSIKSFKTQLDARAAHRVQLGKPARGASGARAGEETATAAEACSGLQGKERE